MDRKTVLRLSLVFGLIYFFSTNGMASLPVITVTFLLKDKLGLSASQAAYFDAITMFGWLIKPLWGIISDTVPVFGYRRKSWLALTAVSAALIWFYLGSVETYTAGLLMGFFTLISLAYAFNDVVCDGLMVETGKPHGLTGRFQSVQWGAVYVAAAITGLAGGWAAANLRAQTTFAINGAFPLVILLAVLIFVREEKSLARREQRRQSFSAIRSAFGDKRFWAAAFFLFFWNFSPSFGRPLQFYQINVLGFDKMFLGVLAVINNFASLLGTALFFRFGDKVNVLRIIRWAIIAGTLTTLFDLIYFAPFAVQNHFAARYLAVGNAAILGFIGAFVSLTLLNFMAIICPKYSEGTAFAALASFWNIGLMGSSAIGGFFFDIIGLIPLVFVSAAFTAAAWFLLPLLKLRERNS